MMASLVRFGSNLTDNEVQATFTERADRYRDVPGLLQKIYVRFRATGEFGALYLQDAEESLIAFRETELARTIPDVYQVTEPPRSDLADVYLIVRPAERHASATG